MRNGVAQAFELPEDDDISPTDDGEEGMGAGAEIPPWTWILRGIIHLLMRWKN